MHSLALWFTSGPAGFESIMIHNEVHPAVLDLIGYCGLFFTANMKSKGPKGKKKSVDQLVF